MAKSKLRQCAHVELPLLQLKFSDNILWNTHFNSNHQYLDQRL